MNRRACVVAAAAACAMLLTTRIGAGQGPRPAAAAAPAFRFTSVAAAIGIDAVHVNGASPDKYLVETMGSGGLFFDFDADGWLDVFLVDGGSLADAAVAATARHRLYRNRGNGTFEEVSARSGIVHRDYGMGACAADYDRDGRIDLYITNLGPNALYRNTGNGTFADVTRAAGVGRPGWSTSCAFADLDRDGDADLVVTNYLDAGRQNNRYCGDARRRVRVYCHPLNYEPLPNTIYRNDGNGSFTDISVQSGVAAVSGNGLGVVIADFDDDRWPDVFVANDAVPNFLFHNDGKGRFREVGLPSGVAVARDGKARAGMGTDVGDFNGDGRLDLVVTNHEFETHSLFRNDGRGQFTDVTLEAGIGPPTLPFVGFGVVFFDADTDGALDLSIVNGHVVDNTALFRSGSAHAQRKLIFRNAGGRFVELGGALAPFAAPAVARTLASGDLDNDGDLDLLVTVNGGPAEVLRNDTPGGRAVLMTLTGVASTTDAIGARVTVTAGGRTQVREVRAGSSYLGQNDLRLHFGLGAAVTIDRIDVIWPSGRTETMTSVATNQRVTIREGAGVTAAVPLRPR